MITQELSKDSDVAPLAITQTVEIILRKREPNKIDRTILITEKEWDLK